MPYEFPDISALDTLAALARADAPALLDIRLSEDVAEDPARLPGAIPVPFDDIERQRALAAPNGAIVICHKGLKLSAGVTARLGARAWRLRGGHVGWTQAGLPTVTDVAPAVLALPLDACPDEALITWAALRFIAPRAALLEVPREDLDGVVARFGAAIAGSPLPLPGMAVLRSATDLLTLALNDGPPSATFPMLDHAYRGALRHETLTGRGEASLVSSYAEDRP